MNVRMMLPAFAILAVPQVLFAQASGEMSASATVEATAQAGLPEAPVRRVVAAGEASGATEAQIDRAAFDTYTRLRMSREALRSEKRPEPTSAEIAAGAEAILAGARPSDLRRVGDAAPASRSVEMSLTVLAQLSARGEDASAAAAAIASRLRAGADDRSLLNLAAQGGVAAMADGGAAAPLDTGVGAGVGADLSGTTGSVGASVSGGLRVGGF